MVCPLKFLRTALESDSAGLDMIVIPGVAFDRDLNRIGHGKGYYDHFFQRCFEHAKRKKKAPPILGNLSGIRLMLVGVALRAQLIGTGRIPMTETDWKMDLLIVDGKVVSKEESKE
jgi:5-formyltetrahydrofolate cyclo-ligase